MSNLSKKITISKLKKMKKQEPIVMITAYDALFSKLFEDEVEIILVGDSLNMSFMGKKDTLSATMEQMIYHTKAVCNGAKKPLIVCDMPFGTYFTKEEALKNGSRVYRETLADAIKIEGGKEKADIVKTLTTNSIAVLGHIGLMPQFVRSEGGYIVRGKTLEDIESLIEDALALEEAGAFGIVIEGVTIEAGKKITEALSIPTIGIGAGKYTDGQVLVWSDAFGFFEEFKPKFVKEYFSGAKEIKSSLKEFTKEVKSKEFPSKEYSY